MCFWSEEDYKFQGFTRTIEDSLCIRCFSCVDSCPHDALHISNLHDPPRWFKHKCVKCLNCLKVCSNKAITFKEVKK